MSTSVRRRLLCRLTHGSRRPERRYSTLDGMTSKRREGESRPDDRPPICPACGVTMGMVIGKKGEATFVCLECGFVEGQD